MCSVPNQHHCRPGRNRKSQANWRTWHCFQKILQVGFFQVRFELAITHAYFPGKLLIWWTAQKKWPRISMAVLPKTKRKCLWSSWMWQGLCSTSLASRRETELLVSCNTNYPVDERFNFVDIFSVHCWGRSRVLGVKDGGHSKVFKRHIWKIFRVIGDCQPNRSL